MSEATSTLTFKQVPASPHPLAFQRQHVRSYFESSSGVPLVLLQAPAGHGKTTVLSFFADQVGDGARWVTLTENERSLAPMIVALISSIYGWPIAPPEQAPDVREAAKWLVGAIEELSVKAFILDDYETVASSDDVNALIEAVIERLPPYVQIAVASETQPPFLRRARLRQAVVELDQSDLRFDADDVAGYLREIHHYEVPDAVATSIARRSGGRAAIVNLVGQLSHDLPRYLRIDFDALPIGPSEEHLTTLLREVLSRAGCPPARAARDLARAEIGYENGTTPTDALLDMLAQRHCLAQRYPTDPAMIVPHKLLRKLAASL